MRQVRGVDLKYNKSYSLWCGQQTDWRINIFQRFSHRSRGSELHVRLPSLGSSTGRWDTRAFGFESHQGLIAEATQDWEGRRLCSWRSYARSRMHGDQGQKQKLDKNLDQTYLLVLESLLERWGWLRLTLGHGHWCLTYLGLFSCRQLTSWLISPEIWAHSTAYRCECWDASG